MPSTKYLPEYAQERSGSTENTHATTFLDLPTETLSNIAHFLTTPIDIANLGMCCRRLQVATHERQVWSAILVDVCHENQVFMPTFPMASMSTEEIKEACTRPFRLRSRIWTGQQHLDDDIHPNDNDDENPTLPSSDPTYPLLKPTHARRLHHPGSNPHDNDTNFVHAHLIPGGRFLLTTDLTDRLCLWDLGYSPETTIPLNPIAFRYFRDPKEFASQQLKHVQPTADGEGLVLTISIATPVDGLSWEQMEECVLEIYPNALSPQFDVIARRIVGSASLCSALAPDFLLYTDQEQNSLVIWYFRAGTFRRVTCPASCFTVLIHHHKAFTLIPNTSREIATNAVLLTFPIPPSPPSSEQAYKSPTTPGKSTVPVHARGLLPLQSTLAFLNFIQSYPWFTVPPLREDLLNELKALLQCAGDVFEKARIKLDLEAIHYKLGPPTFGSPRAPESHVAMKSLRGESMWLRKGRFSSDLQLLVMRDSVRSEGGEADRGELARVALDWTGDTLENDIGSEDENESGRGPNDDNEDDSPFEDWGSDAQLMCPYSGRLAFVTEGGSIKILDFV